MINNTSLRRWERAKAKSLDQQFLNEMREGLNCSRFEAQAILDQVHEIFAPLLSASYRLHPGQILVSVVEASVPAGVALSEASQKLVRLTLDAGTEDVEVREKQGVSGLRQHRLERMAVEAFQQGTLLTLEDLAKLFDCGVRTLVRDLAGLRQRGIEPPLRSRVRDMGRAVTHRRQIVEQWLRGSEYSEIAREQYHSVASVARYVDQFKRCASLFQEAFDLHTVAFLVGISPTLAGQFHQLWSEVEPVEHRRRELQVRGEKNEAFDRRPPS
jgi:hypothetical protein